jgi:hypothetical protein
MTELAACHQAARGCIGRPIGCFLRTAHPSARPDRRRIRVLPGARIRGLEFLLAGLGIAATAEAGNLGVPSTEAGGAVLIRRPSQAQEVLRPLGEEEILSLLSAWEALDRDGRRLVRFFASPGPITGDALEPFVGVAAEELAGGEAKDPRVSCRALGAAMETFFGRMAEGRAPEGSSSGWREGSRWLVQAARTLRLELEAGAAGGASTASGFLRYEALLLESSPANRQLLAREPGSLVLRDLAFLCSPLPLGGAAGRELWESEWTEVASGPEEERFLRVLTPRPGGDECLWLALRPGSRVPFAALRLSTTGQPLTGVALGFAHPDRSDGGPRLRESLGVQFGARGVLVLAHRILREEEVLDQDLRLAVPRGTLLIDRREPAVVVYGADPGAWPEEIRSRCLFELQPEPFSEPDAVTESEHLPSADSTRAPWVVGLLVVLVGIFWVARRASRPRAG